MVAYVAGAVSPYVTQDDAVRIAARATDALIEHGTVREWGYTPEGELLYEPTEHHQVAYLVIEEDG